MPASLARTGTFVCLIFGIIGSIYAQSLGNATDGPPHILVILVDDLGKEWLSCYGAEDIQTPNIDALAGSGTKFNHFYSMPQCTPTRVSLLTGQYPFRHGWVNHWDVPRWGAGAHFDENLNPALTTQLKQAGYRTCIAGKWQIDDFRVEPDALTKIGFDAYCMWTGYESEVPASAERYQDPYLYSYGVSRTYEDAFGPDVFKDFIIDFIKENKAQPMFIYYPMVLTHTPFVDTPTESAPDKLGKHKAMVRYTDKITGDLIAALEAENIRDQTLILWTTDNGTTGQISGSYRGEMVQGGKGKTLESGISAPFIASWPGVVAAGKSSDALVDMTDILPTCIDLAGSTPPLFWDTDVSKEPIDGRSFKQVLMNGREKSSRTWILSMGGGNHAKRTSTGVENQYIFRDRVLSNGKYKLYYGSHGEPEAFYHLQADPFERKNILAHVNGREDQENLQALLEACRAFPQNDADPRYRANPSQTWDVPITAETQTWKK